jgi:hypothetical protein
MNTRTDEILTRHLMASLIRQNVDDATHTANVLIEFEKDSARRLAEALLALDAAIDNSPVIDRRLLDLQASLAATFELAERYVRERSE